MKDRTVLILQTLVQEFIETATPVASKKLLESSELQISSATVRNEFAILEEVGLIHSPHVSAGKVPTEKGYRFFVDHAENAAFDEMAVKTVFEKYVQEYKLQKSKEILFDALRLLSQLTANVAFARVQNDRTAYLGLSNVLRSPEFVANPEQAAQVVEILEGRERFAHFLEGNVTADDGIKIFIGEENLFEEISSCAMVVSAFEHGDIRGHIGILGPMRMKYNYNKTLLKEVLGLF